MFKILLMGSGDFARGVLEGILATEHKVVGFFPWEARGKPSLKTRLKRHFVADHLTLAQEHELALLQMQSANSAQFARYVDDQKPDVILVAGWGEILQPEIIKLPAVACVNSHPSLLPFHRGAAPVASVLREGEKQTGVTFHYLTAQIDAGNILHQSALPIFDCDNYASLSRRIALRAKETVGAALANVGREGLAQPEANASYFYRPSGKDLWLDWRRPARVLRNYIRSTPCGSHYLTRHRHQTLELLEAELVELITPSPRPGAVLDKSGSRLLVATGDPKAALFIKAGLRGSRLGLLAKYYCLNKIHVGDLVSSEFSAA